MFFSVVLLGIVGGLMGAPADMLVNNPDYVVYVPELPCSAQNKNKPFGDLSRRGDSYNDHFQVLEDGKRGLLYAFWTQASWEGCSDQHIAFSKSADRGRTWTKPIILAGSECRAYPKLRASWQQPMLSRSGRLYCLWNQQTTSRKPHYGQMFGSYSEDAGESWSEPLQVPFPRRMDQDDPDPTVPPQWCNWQRPLRLGEGGRFFVGCSRHGKAPYDAKSCCKIEFWQFENIDDDPVVPDIRFSQFATNRDSLSADRVAPIPGVRYFVPTRHPYGGPEDTAVEEASVVRLPDGRLFAMMRSSIGCPVWSQSRDGGRSWSGPKALLDGEGRPFPHPRSPCPLYDWKGGEAGSGLYFGLVHMTFDMKRETAYQKRGPLYLIAGRFDPTGDQPIRFRSPKLFAPRPEGNSFYSSYTVLDGEGVLWFNDKKYYLLGRKIDAEWFEGLLPKRASDERRLTLSRAEWLWRERMRQDPLKVIDCQVEAWRQTFDILHVERALDVFDTLEGESKTNAAKRLACVMPESHARIPEIRSVANVPLSEQLCTEGLQRRIDEAGAADGGEVRLTAGTYVTGTLWLRSGVTLRLDKGAVLKGSRDFARYDTSLGANRIALLQACGATNIAVVGEGVIDGNGQASPYRLWKKRWKVVYCADCRGVRVEGVRVLGANSWTMYFDRVDGVRVKGVVIRSRQSGGADGIDIRARNVLIEGCDIDAEDDAIVLKNAVDEGFPVENVTIRDCTISSECNAFKIGTETAGDIRNVTVEDIRVIQRFAPHGKDWSLKPGCSGWKRALGISAFAVESVDGAAVENVTVRRCRVEEGYMTPFFVRLGARNKHNDSGRAGRISNVLFEDVQAVANSWIASSVTGVPGLSISGVTFRRVGVTVPGDALEDATWTRVPDDDKTVREYPDAYMFGGSLPAYGLYARHVNGLVLEGLTLRYRGAHESRRPVVTENVEGFREVACAYQPPVELEGDARTASVERCHALSYWDETSGRFSETLYWCPEESWHVTGWGALYSRSEKPCRLEVVPSRAAFVQKLQAAKRKRFALLCAENAAVERAAAKWFSCLCDLTAK